jgi:hypothetical protein
MRIECLKVGHAYQVHPHVSVRTVLIGTYKSGLRPRTCLLQDFVCRFQSHFPSHPSLLSVSSYALTPKRINPVDLDSSDTIWQYRFHSRFPTSCVMTRVLCQIMIHYVSLICTSENSPRFGSTLDKRLWPLGVKLKDINYGLTLCAVSLL